MEITRELNEALICNMCRQTVNNEETTIIDDVTLCNDCLCEYTSVCDDCGKRTLTDECEEDDNLLLCHDCFEISYHRCTECSCLVNDEDVIWAGSYDDYPYCSRCYDERELDNDDDDYCDERVIHSYNYRPIPLFYGTGIYYGIELEVDTGGKCIDNAAEILEIANEYNEHIYIKHDGSLSNGFEVVSHPMSLIYHQSSMPWQRSLHRLINLGYLSHKTQTCGYHIHIGRSSLGNNEEEQELCISKILYFVEKHWEELLNFSRRSLEKINQWAPRYGYLESPAKLLDYAKTINYRRYICVNLQNTSTIEFRIFKGTLKLSTFLATLQLVDEICCTALKLSSQEIQDLEWAEFVATINLESKKELVSYLTTRGLHTTVSACEEECGV